MIADVILGVMGLAWYGLLAVAVIVAVIYGLAVAFDRSKGLKTDYGELADFLAKGVHYVSIFVVRFAYRNLIRKGRWKRSLIWLEHVAVILLVIEALQRATHRGY